MKDMNIPVTGNKKALLIVDLQPAFIKPHNRHIINNIKALLENVTYDCYAEAVFHAEEDSLWQKQQQWFCPKNNDTRTVEEIRPLLKQHQPLQILKSTRSAFRGNQDVRAYLLARDVQEVHIVGTETNDCILATAFDAFDSGFLPYVIEECCESGTEGRHEMGLKLLRIQGMSNNRCLASTTRVSREI